MNTDKMEDYADKEGSSTESTEVPEDTEEDS
jgi:hypothetical protein